MFALLPKFHKLSQFGRTILILRSSFCFKSFASDENKKFSKIDSMNFKMNFPKFQTLKSSFCSIHHKVSTGLSHFFGKLSQTMEFYPRVSMQRQCLQILKCKFQFGKINFKEVLQLPVTWRERDAEVHGRSFLEATATVETRKAILEISFLEVRNKVFLFLWEFRFPPLKVCKVVRHKLRQLEMLATGVKR